MHRVPPHLECRYEKVELDSLSYVRKCRDRCDKMVLLKNPNCSVLFGSCQKDLNLGAYRALHIFERQDLVN